ncbi:MAG: class I SAM-dependent methyltransferase [Clostridiales bacterium]|nr:class I SAM-dependent methyltransferase [Clostridiales bacterium]
MYTAFAQVYDELMKDVNYIAWADFYGQMMAYYGLRSGKIVECACGTGNLTLPLYQKGYSITGIDISAEMLWEASKKARKAGMQIPFVRQDMCALRLHRAMDAVLCTCDGVNYLTSLKQVKAFFTAAYQALRPGGCLFFDISTPYKLSHLLGNNLLWEDTEKYSYAWDNTFDEEKSLIEMNLAIFEKNQEGLYRRIDEHQIQRAHQFEELEKLLIETGFAQIACYGDRHMDVPSLKEQRWHIAARKPADPSLYAKQEQDYYLKQNSLYYHGGNR